MPFLFCQSSAITRPVKVWSERCEAYWKCSCASCNAEGKSWSGFGFSLANDCQASRAAVSLVLEIPWGTSSNCLKRYDEQNSWVIWGSSKETLEEKTDIEGGVIMLYFFFLFFKEDGKKKKHGFQRCYSISLCSMIF